MAEIVVSTEGDMAEIVVSTEGDDGRDSGEY